MSDRSECQFVTSFEPMFAGAVHGPAFAEIRCVTHNNALAGSMKGNRCLTGRIEDLEAEVAELKKPA